MDLSVCRQPAIRDIRSLIPSIDVIVVPPVPIVGFQISLSQVRFLDDDAVAALSCYACRNAVIHANQRRCITEGCIPRQDGYGPKCWYNVVRDITRSARAWSQYHPYPPRRAQPRPHPDHQRQDLGKCTRGVRWIRAHSSLVPA